MAERYYVTVLLPVVVAEGRYCWEQGRRVCDHFDNDRAIPRCELGLADRLEQDEAGHYPKPARCLSLEEQS